LIRDSTDEHTVIYHKQTFDLGGKTGEAANESFKWIVHNNTLPFTIDDDFSLTASMKTYATTITDGQKRAALRVINLIKEKRSGKLKGRTCADGRPQRALYTKEETTSPTVSTDALMLSHIIVAKEGRDVATADVEGAYLHALTKSPSAPSEERVEKPRLDSILRSRSVADGQTLGALPTTGKMSNDEHMPTYAAVAKKSDQSSNV
jgi:hypothetical protein